MGTTVVSVNLTDLKQRTYFLKLKDEMDFKGKYSFKLYVIGSIQDPLATPVGTTAEKA